METATQFKPVKPITSADEVKKQQDAVVFHLVMLHGITSKEAFSEWGITRLSDIIHKLRKIHGWEIKSNPMTITNRFGHDTTFSKYELISTPATNEQIHS